MRGFRTAEGPSKTYNNCRQPRARIRLAELSRIGRRGMNIRKHREGTIVTKPVRRREALSALGAVGSSVFLGCGSGSGDTGGKEPTPNSRSASCRDVPDETAGPFPDTKGMIVEPEYYRADIS